MKGKDSANSTQSIHQKLIRLSHRKKEDPNHILILYAIERLLYRLSRSAYAGQFVLKGAILFTCWTDKRYRPTRDLDLLGFGDASQDNLKKVFVGILRTAVPPDGLTFDPDSIAVEEIREAQEYPGKRIKLTAYLGNARLNLQIDIGFGDAVTPKPVDILFPSLLDLPQAQLKACPVETVIAEKVQTIVALDMTTSRMKDFYDLWIISRFFELNGLVLLDALNATFKHRNTQFPTTIPAPLTEQFAANPDKIGQWTAFLKRSRLTDSPINLEGIINDLAAFIWPPLQAAATQSTFQQQWKQGRWQTETGRTNSRRK